MSNMAGMEGLWKRDTRKPENLKKMHLIELKEILAREEALLRNKSLISKLPDKGKSVTQFHELIQKELKHRQEIEALENQLGNLNISEADKHVQKICQIETNPKKERYKPFCTLNRTQELHTDRKVFKTMEDWSGCSRSTKLIPLKESLEILKVQDEKLKEEQVKIKHRLLLQSNEDDEEDGNSTTDDELSENGDEIS